MFWLLFREVRHVQTKYLEKQKITNQWELSSSFFCFSKETLIIRYEKATALLQQSLLILPKRGWWPCSNPLILCPCEPCVTGVTVMALNTNKSAMLVCHGLLCIRNGACASSFIYQFYSSTVPLFSLSLLCARRKLQSINQSTAWRL